MRGRTAVLAVTVVAVALAVRFYGAHAPEAQPEPARRDVIKAGIEAAAAQAGVRRHGITASSVAYGDGESPPPKECTLTWTGRTAGGSPEDAHQATVAALEERGWEVDRRLADGPVPSTRLRHRGWTLEVVSGSLPSSPTLTFLATAPAC